jgi:hypothetical protein
MFPLTDLIGAATKILERVLPDPKARAEALLKLKEMEQAGELAKLNADLVIISGQNEVNKAEASNPHLFVSGARPFVLWVCASALAVQLVIGPLVVWGSALANHPVQLPAMQTELLTTLLIGMLGLGGMRTLERLNGVANGQK